MQISISIRVAGDRLLPDEITSILRVSPHVARRKGEVRVSSSGKEIHSKFGLWTWKSEDVSRTLTINEHLDRLGAAFGHAFSALGNLPNAENSWVDICIVRGDMECEPASIEFLLDTRSIAILHEIGLPVEFTVYN